MSHSGPALETKISKQIILDFEGYIKICTFFRLLTQCWSLSSADIDMESMHRMLRRTPIFSLVCLYSEEEKGRPLDRITNQKAAVTLPRAHNGPNFIKKYNCWILLCLPNMVPNHGKNTYDNFVTIWKISFFILTFLLDFEYKINFC